MNDSHLVSIAQIREFLKVATAINFTAASRAEKYEWLNNTLTRFQYFKLKKKEKSVIKNYLVKMTGFSDPQIKRLIGKKRRTGTIQVSEGFGRHHRFTVRYHNSLQTSPC